MRTPLAPPSDDDILVLEPAVRRLAAAYDADAADDLVQETLTRLFEVRGRLERRTLAAYAAVTMRNLISSSQRERALAERYRPRLVTIAPSDDPADAAVRDAEAGVVRQVVGSLPASDRDMLVARTVLGVPTEQLASASATTSGALATRLSRVRARARVDYAIRWRGASLPTPRCRPVLMAIAAGDKHRQRALSAAEHLLECTPCADLTETVTARSRPLTGIVPLSLLAGAGRTLRRHPTQAAGVAVAVAVAAALLVLSPWNSPAPPASPQTSTPQAASLSIDSEPINTGWARQLRGAAGQTATGNNLIVARVAGDELVLLRGRQEDVWVRLRGEGESPFDVVVGQRASFTGTVRRHTPRLVDRLDVDGRAAVMFRRAGVHVAVEFDKFDLHAGRQ